MNWVRVETPPALLALGSPDMRVFQTNVRDGHLSVFSGREPDGSRAVIEALRQP